MGRRGRLEKRKGLLIGVAIALVVVLVSGGLFLRSRLSSESLCALVDAQLPSITDEQQIDTVIAALRARAEVLGDRYDVSDDDVKVALSTLAEGFTRIADEIENSGKEWNLDEVVSELAKDPALTSANLALEGALRQCS